MVRYIPEFWQEVTNDIHEGQHDPLFHRQPTEASDVEYSRKQSNPNLFMSWLRDWVLS